MNTVNLLATAAVATITATASMATTMPSEVFNASSAGGHSVYINGTQYHFEPGATFTDNGDTATLSGTALNGSDGFVVLLEFEDFPMGSEPDPKRELGSSNYSENGGPVDTSTWDFWDMIEGGVSTFTGVGSFAGLTFDVLSKPLDETYGFQAGVGANGKNTELGLSGWFLLEGQDAASAAANPCSVNGGRTTCDVNINLSPVPLPASALLLVGGMVGLVGMRRRRKAA